MVWGGDEIVKSSCFLGQKFLAREDAAESGAGEEGRSETKRDEASRSEPELELAAGRSCLF